MLFRWVAQSLLLGGKSVPKTCLSQKSGINMRGLRGDLIVSSAAGPRCRFHNKVWWGTHGVAVVTQNSGQIFPTTHFVDQNISWLLSANQIHTSQRRYSVNTLFTRHCWEDRVDWCGIYGVCLYMFFNEMDKKIELLTGGVQQETELRNGGRRVIGHKSSHIPQWSITVCVIQSPMRQS